MWKFFESSNMIIMLFNILFFIVVQTLFFKKVASQQFSNVLKDKVDILNTYLNQDAETTLEMKTYLESDKVKQIYEKANIQEKERIDINNTLTNNKIWYPFIPLIFLLIGGFIFGLRFSNIFGKWSNTDSWILSLVVLAYTTELMFFFQIVRKYEFYGDQRIYSSLYSTILQYLQYLKYTYKWFYII